MIKNLLNKLFRGNKNNEELQALKEQNEMLMAQMQDLMTKMMNSNEQVAKEVAVDVAKEVVHEEIVEEVIEVVEEKREMPKMFLNKQDLKEDMEKIGVKEELKVEAEIKLEEGLAKDIRPVDMRDLDYSKLSDDRKLDMKAELRESIFKGGIENVATVCDEYPTELLQHYLISLMCANNTYQAEFVNVESMSREQIIASIDEINFDNFKEVMSKKGITVKEPSEGQIKKLKELGVNKMPKTSFGASEIIKSFVGESDNKPTESQIKRINALVERLGLQGEEVTYKTKYDASKIIGELQAKADEVLGAEPATKEQIRYYAQLLKACNKRLTQSRKEFAHSCTKKQISEEIEKLKEELKTLHPYVSEGQLNYLISLHQMLMLSFNIDDLKKLTKEEGTELISKLRREYLYMETRRYQASLTMKAINDMTDDEVTSMLNQINNDKKDSKAV